MSNSVRIPRGRRTFTATLVAVLVVLACAFVTTEAIALAVHDRTVWFSVHDLARFARHTQLDETLVLVVSIVVFAVGAVLLIAALIPSRRRLVELSGGEQGVAAGLTKGSFRRTIAAAAVQVDGVTSARVRGRHLLRIRARTTLRDTDGMQDRIRERVDERVAQLQPVLTRTVRVRLDRKDS